MKLWHLAVFAIVAILLYLAWLLVLPIPTGYAAKNMCSSIFVAEIDEQTVNEVDLGFSVLKLTRSEIDRSTRTVTSTFLGLRPSRAVYVNDQLGCTLIGDSPVDRDLAVTPVAPAEIDSLGWPYGPRKAAPTNSKLNEAIQAVLETEMANRELQTRALLVVHNDEIIGESYAPGFDTLSRQLGWSMTKSLTATMVGILVQQGKVDIDDPAPVAAWKEDERGAITWRNLLQMNSGLKWTENYFWVSNITRMLYDVDDTYTYSANVDLQHNPGEEWRYSSGTTNILSGLVRRVLSDDSRYLSFPNDQSVFTDWCREFRNGN